MDLSNASKLDLTHALSLSQIKKVYERISPLLKETPVTSLPFLKEVLKHNILFKVESVQETGSFKVRGVLNALLQLQQEKNLQKVSTYSTGNHGLALAWAGQKLGLQEVKIFLPSCASDIKKKLPEKYGAKVVVTSTRQEAEEQAYASVQDGYYLIPPSDKDEVIAGASTVLYEALRQLPDVALDAVFIPVGGGSLSSGTLLSKNCLQPSLKVYAGEPKNANDASISHKTGKLFRFEKTPQTIADGATALGLPNRTFQYVRLLDGVYEITEEEILYWATWFCHLSEYKCEPTAALSLAAAYRWLMTQPSGKQCTVLVIISGGNILPDVREQLYSKDFLKICPSSFKP